AMKNIFNRRQFLQTGAVAGASLVLPKGLFAAGKKSVLIFTKSSGFEHDVVKTTSAKPSILEAAITTLGKKHGFDVTATKDGAVFDSKDFHKYAAVLFFTTGDLTTVGTDKNRLCRRKVNKSCSMPSIGDLDLWASMPRAIPSIPRPILRTMRTATSPMGRNLIPICECWAVSSLLTAARRACRMRTSLSTTRSSQASREFPLRSALTRSGIR